MPHKGQPTALERELEGRKIAAVYEIRVGSSGSVCLKLDDGKQVMISQKCGPGFGWNNWLSIEIGGKEVFRG